MAKYERFFPEYKKQLTDYEDRLAMLMQYTTWDLKEEEMRHKLKETAKSLKDMAISEWKSKQKASCEKKAEKSKMQTDSMKVKVDLEKLVCDIFQYKATTDVDRTVHITINRVLYDALKMQGLEFDFNTSEIHKRKQTPKTEESSSLVSIEWREEDEEMLKWIFNHLETNNAIALEKVTKWLKSLRLQKNWKPNGD